MFLPFAVGLAEGYVAGRETWSARLPQPWYPACLLDASDDTPRPTALAHGRQEVAPVTTTKSSSSLSHSHRLEFETLVSDLSARFVQLSAEAVDGGIQDALEKLLSFFQVDRCGLIRVRRDRGISYVSHAAYAEGAQRVPRELNLVDLFPYHYDRLVERGENVAFRRLSDLPNAGEVDRQSFSQMGVRSALHIPLRLAGATRYIMALNSVHREIAWPPDYFPRLRLVGEIFVGALERKRADFLLEKSEARLRLAAESAGMGIWDLDRETGRFWVTDRVRELFGYAPGDDVTLEDVLRRIHAEDSGKVRQTLEDAIREQEQGNIEYRVARPDGSFRWLISRGRPHRSPSAGSDAVLGVTYDVTERKEAEIKLRDGAERAAAAAAVAGLGYYEAFWGEPRAVVEASLRDLLGLPPEEEPRAMEYWLEHVHPEDRGRLLELRPKFLGPGSGPMTVQYRYQHPTKGQRWLHHSVRVLDRDEQGQVVRSLGVFHDITEQKRAEEGLRQALEETRRLKEELEHQNVYLSTQLKENLGGGAIVGESEPILAMLAHARRVAPTDATVLITGETGTGKELLAQATHEMSRRRDKPMITVNCAALPPTLIESELFGRERGAYTGAMTHQIGRFELANGSTIFLDEIAELPLELQVKLLRVLQEGRFERLGSRQTRAVDVRVVAATNRDLGALIREGRFRSDLFYRLSVFPIEVPPLRDRHGDIALLVWHFVRYFCQKMGKTIDTIPRKTLETLQRHRWPGNVRELRNLMERSVILSDTRVLVVPLGAAAAPESDSATTLEEVERRHILQTLENTGWRIQGPGGAAEQLGLIPTTLHSRLKKLGISRPRR